MRDSEGPDPGFGLYLHWPFCQSKCPYCDFNSHVTDRIDMDRWAEAYLHELDRAAMETEGRRLNSVFFGGGTPSLMSPDLVGRILDRIRLRWGVANDWEVTLEANPGSVEAGKFQAFRQAGVNRLSLGIQALNDPDLRRLGRLHTVEDALRAFEVARAAFDRISFDLIYARQDQTPEMWENELQLALSLAVDHLSLYQLTIEDGTAFGDRHARGKLSGLPDDDRSVELFRITQDLCESAGLPAYEVSNHARPGSESKHNLIYWRTGDYIGIGPGAHGRLTSESGRVATEAIRAPGAWLSGVESVGNGELTRDIIVQSEQALEYLMMSLRLSEGMNKVRFLRIAGRSLDPEALAELVDLGYIEDTPEQLKATSSGRLLLNAVIRRLARDF